MLYNHRQFRKNSDKKIMRKVKKNWIVLSVASFALIGASAVIESNQIFHLLAKLKLQQILILIKTIIIQQLIIKKRILRII